MKKILYLVIGILVGLAGAWLIYFWWDKFVTIFKGLIGPMVILAGAIVFIVGLMTPFKEEADDFDASCDTDLDETEENQEESDTETEKKES